MFITRSNDAKYKHDFPAFFPFLLNRLAPAVTFATCILKGSDMNLVRDTNYPGSLFPDLFRSTKGIHDLISYGTEHLRMSAHRR
jgi:hypothetical protein